jgi:putative membrane protein
MKPKITALLLVVALACAISACKRANEGVEENPPVSTTAVDGGSATDTASATTTAATGGTTSNMPGPDKEFAMKAAQGSMAEVQMGQLALQQATNADVKTFAQRMVTDHGAATTELSQLATTKGLVLPSDVGEEHKQGMQHLQGLTGAEFDKAYMQHMVADHQKDTSEFQNATTALTDADLRAFATKTLPTLQDHLRQAQEVSGKLK